MHKMYHIATRDQILQMYERCLTAGIYIMHFPQLQEESTITLGRWSNGFKNAMYKTVADTFQGYFP